MKLLLWVSVGRRSERMVAAKFVFR